MAAGDITTSTSTSTATSTAHPQAGQGIPLPKKEADLFKHIVKHYESKQYKKAIKVSDLILKKFPHHGETLAMKGLTLSSLQKREEAHALVKQGLRFDMRSHVCWHVYGLLHRAERNYNEAIKAYKQALKIDPDNGQILRDLSLLQIQMRDVNGFCHTRNTLLAMKSNAKGNWLSLALAKHLCGDFQDALQVLSAYTGTLPKHSPELIRSFESSELALYTNQIMGEINNNHQKALEHLFTIEHLVMDTGAWLRSKATYEMALNKWDDAQSSFMQLFQRGITEDYVVHSGYMCAILHIDNHEHRQQALHVKGMDTLATITPLTTTQKQTLLTTYQNTLLPKFPNSQAIQRIPLTLLEGNDFKTAVDAYCRPRLSKGVPSLGWDLSSLLLHHPHGSTTLSLVKDAVDVVHHDKFLILVDLADSYIANLQLHGTLDNNHHTDSNGNDQKESPSTILWAWYLRAGLHEIANQYSHGIALLDQCLEHTPTAVDVYELKARLLKAAGNLTAAVECLDKGRELDKQDRYINNQTCKYMLQAGMEQKALERISLFTKHEGDPENNLFLMQCSWYELELAACLARKEKWGLSLKKYYAVLKHFDDFHEDQFDFHSYCIRKVTLRAYTNLLRWEDNLWGQPYYGKAAEGIIKIYLHLYDNPSIVAQDAEPDYGNMSAADRKKAKALLRKKKKKEDSEKAMSSGGKEPNETADGGGGKKKKAPDVVVDDDPEGQLLFHKDPLNEAKNLSSILSKHVPFRLSTWLLQYDVSSRRGKGLLALQALFKAKALAPPDSAEVFSRMVDFSLVWNSWILSDVVRVVFESEVPKLFDGTSVEDHVLSMLEKVKSDPLIVPLPLRVQVAKALVKIQKASVAEAAALIVEGGLSGRGVTAVNCHEALRVLVAMDVDADCISNWKSVVSLQFPLLQEW